jgi:hypothetical protein
MDTTYLEVLKGKQKQTVTKVAEIQKVLTELKQKRLQQFCQRTRSLRRILQLKFQTKRTMG